jgi:nitroreductase
MTTSNSRTSEFDIDPMFLDRWSPRAFTGEAMDKTVLLTILEAAHWAPSASNYQPWRFIYTLNTEPDWDRFIGLLNESNQVWARSASALVFLFSDSLSRRDDGSEPKPRSPSASAPTRPTCRITSRHAKCRTAVDLS